MLENSKSKNMSRVQNFTEHFCSWKAFVLQNARNNKQKKKQTKTITKIDMKGEKAFWEKLKMKMNKFIIHYNRKMEIIYLPRAEECVCELLYPCYSLQLYCWLLSIEILCGIIKGLSAFIFFLKSDLYQNWIRKHFSHYPSFHYFSFCCVKGTGRVFFYLLTFVTSNFCSLLTILFLYLMTFITSRLLSTQNSLTLFWSS